MESQKNDKQLFFFLIHKTSSLSWIHFSLFFLLFVGTAFFSSSFQNNYLLFFFLVNLELSLFFLVNLVCNIYEQNFGPFPYNGIDVCFLKVGKNL